MGKKKQIEKWCAKRGRYTIIIRKEGITINPRGSSEFVEIQFKED